MKRRADYQHDDYSFDIGSYSFVVDQKDTPKKHFDTITKNIKTTLYKPEVRRRIKWATVIILIVNIIGWSLTSYLITKPQLSEAAPTQNGRVIYSNNTTTPQNRSYSAAANSFSAGAAMNTAAAPTHMVDKASATRNEHIAGYVTTGGVLYVTKWDGSSWTAQWNFTVGGNGVDGRRFDIVYEKTSGNAIVAYSTGVNGNAGAEIGYDIWNGTSWAGAATITSARFTQASPVAWVKLAANPTASSNEVVLTAQDSGTTTVNTSVLTSFVWNGSNTWTEPTAAHTVAATLYMTNTTGQIVQNNAYDVTYETTTGNIFIVFTTNPTSTTGQQYYIRRSSGAWGTAVSYATGRMTPLQMLAESNPNSAQVLAMWSRVLAQQALLVVV
jgi:hypothetical protein